LKDVSELPSVEEVKEMISESQKEEIHDEVEEPEEENR